MNKYCILSLVVGIILGFFLSNISTQKEKIKYIKGPTQIETIPPNNIILEKEIAGSVIFLPKIYWLRDTINNTIVEKADTVKVFNDYLLERKYNINLFNNENGEMKVEAWVQYNKMRDFKYTYTPITKEITKIRERVIVPFEIGRASCRERV